jgi:hypothetical protein
MRLAFHLVTSAALAVVAPALASAQAVDTPAGRVEFVGLRRWTVDMIRDSMRVHAPGKPLGQCAAVLRGLGFPSAETIGFGGTDYTLVMLVEPQDSARVRYRREPRDSQPVVAAWAEGYRLLRENRLAFQSAVQLYSIQRARDSVFERSVLTIWAADSSIGRATWKFLDGRRGAGDARIARRRLLDDARFETRLVAAAVLAAHRDDPRTWHTLVQALTTSDGRVAGAAQQALTSLISGPAIRIDWAPVAPELRAILDGTNVLALRTTMLALTKTGASPRLAPHLLADGGTLPLALLGASPAIYREAAHGFLTHMAERDLGDEPAAWERWIHALH